MNPTPESAPRGNVRLFPLPGVVMFPSSVLPLRIFEPRYVQMVEDALLDDKSFVLALPSSENDPEPVPLRAIGCVGTIIQQQRLPNGHFNLLFFGATRVRLLHEYPQTRLYRQARVEMMLDIPPPPNTPGQHLWRDTILSRLKQLAPHHSQNPMDTMALIQKLSSVRDLGALCDVASFVTALPFETKLRLRENPRVEERLRLLADALDELVKVRKQSEKPRPFSDN